MSDLGFHYEEEFGYTRGNASHMPLDVARFFVVRELTRWRDATVVAIR